MVVLLPGMELLRQPWNGILLEVVLHGNPGCPLPPHHLKLLTLVSDLFLDTLLIYTFQLHQLKTKKITRRLINTFIGLSL